MLQETAVRHFLEVVRRGSITEAATTLNLAWSAISRQIAWLAAERIGNELAALKGLRRGEVKLATIVDFALEFVPAALEQFCRQHRDIRFQLSVGNALHVAQQIRGKTMKTLQLEIQSLAGSTLPDAARAFLNALIARASGRH